MSEIIPIADLAVAKKIVGPPLVTFRAPLCVIDLPAPAAAALQRHEWLTQWSNTATWVPSANSVAAAHSTIEQVLALIARPATEGEIRSAVTIIAGSWPNGRPPDPDVYLAGMLQELSGYSAPILSIAISQARRTLDWLPTIAQMVSLCDAAKKKFEGLRLAPNSVTWRREALETQCKSRRRDVALKIAGARYCFADLLLDFRERYPTDAIQVDPVSLDLAARYLKVSHAELLHGHPAWPDVTDPAPIIEIAKKAHAAGIKSDLEVDERE